MGYMLLPRFHLAFRRTLFFLIILGVYLMVGALLFFVLWRKGPPISQKPVNFEKLDFERTELLNILYAESIGRSELDWAQFANQKLDTYERSLVERSENGYNEIIRQRRMSLNFAFRHAFSLITTIGPVDVDIMSTEMKLFSIFYALIGIPLTWLYLHQCANTLSSVFPERGRMFLLLILMFFTLAILYDIFEQGSNDTPFLNVILSVFFTMTTIGLEDDKDELPTVLLIPVAILGLSAFSVVLLNIQHEIEIFTGSYEINFAHSYAKLERVISGHRLEVLEEVEADEDEDENEKSESVYT